MTACCRRAGRGELAAPRPGCWGAGVAIPKAGQRPTATSLRQTPGSALGGTAGTPDGEKQRRFWGGTHLPSPLSLHKQLSTSPGARCWLCTGRASRATSLEHSGRGPQKRCADPAGLLQRCARTSAREGLRGKYRVP